jgi:hypothetical protein
MTRWPLVCRSGARPRSWHGAFGGGKVRGTSLASLAVLAAATLSLIGSRVCAADLNFAGSAQLDEFLVPSQARDPIPGGGQYAIDGFTLEASEKVAADVSSRLSANFKVCFGCHGFELDMAYFDFRVADELNVRAGRFSPSFGGFNLRHDVGNHKLSDKPLPYDMGRMLRLRTWNLGVLPSPFPDMGVEVNGTHWFGDTVQLDYAVYAVQGFRSNAPHPLDIDFRISHLWPQAYYIDNNGRPTLGARSAITAKLGERSDLTIGASGMYGTYDGQNALTYAIVGADVSLRIVRTALRLEYLARRTQMDTSDPTQFALPLDPSTDDSFVKHGAYVEIEQPLLRELDLIGRVDGMYRIGNFPASSSVGTGGQAPSLSRRSTVIRYTLGTSWMIERSLRLKLSAELWQFSDRDDETRTQQVGLHSAIVGTF